jgi:hypothetical protein
MERRGALWLVGAAGVFLVIWLFGFLTSMAFNTMLDIPLSFTADSPMGWWKWGFMSLVPPVIYVTTVTVAALALASIRRLVARLSPSLDAPWRSLARRLRAAADRAGFNDPVTAAHALLALHIAIVAAVIWAFRDLLGGLVNYATTPAPAPALLQPANYETLSTYRAIVDLTIFVFGIAWWRIWRRLRTSPGGTATFPTIVAGVGSNLVLILLIVVPYRIAAYNSFERVDLAGARCYQIGRQGDSVLLHCPDLPSRNRVVSGRDTRLRRTGRVESVFTPPAGP